MIWSRVLPVFSALQSFALPAQCVSYTAPVQAAQSLCPVCWSRLHFITAPLCERYGTPFSYAAGQSLSPRAISFPPVFRRARAAVSFDGPARDLVHGLKYQDRLDFIPLLARMMMQAGAELLHQADILVPVPLHWTRLWRRRFNQAGELAKALAQTTELPCDLNALVRRKRTKTQIGMRSDERQRNVSGVFGVPDAARVRGRCVLLIDDVLTSGATANACAGALIKAGAVRVDVLTFAMVVKSPDFAYEEWE